MDIHNFYNSYGWKKNKKVFEDANLFEDLRKNSRFYVSKCRKRLMRYIPKKGDHILDFASGPIQYPEYLQYSKNFKKRHCIDFSKDAIKIAKKKIGTKKGKFYCEDFFKLKFKNNLFDCAISLHTIYHINKNKQKFAINKLLDISKPDAPIIIVYSNPNTLINKIKKIFFYKEKKNKIYFYCHPIKWWDQFNSRADVKLYPWRSFSSQHQKIIFANNFFGKLMLKFLYILEDRFSNFFINNFQYYTIVIKKY